MIKLIALIIISLNTFKLVAQPNKNDSKLIIDLINLDFKSIELNLNNKSYNSFDRHILLLKNLLKNNGQLNSKDSISYTNFYKSNFKKKDDLVEILNNLINGYYFLLNKKNGKRAFIHFNRAYNSAKNLKNNELQKLSIISILNIYIKQPIQTIKTYKPYLSELNNLKVSSNDSIIFDIYKSKLLSTTFPLDKDYFVYADKLKKIRNTGLSLAYQTILLDQLGAVYRIKGNIINSKKHLDTAYFYFKKIVSLDNNTFNRNYKFNAYLEIAHLEALKGNSSISKQKLKNALKYINKSDTLHSLFNFERWKTYYVHKILNENDSAFYSLDKAFVLSAQMNLHKNTREIAELNVELNTAEKEKQILLEQQKNKQQKNLIIGSILFIILGGTIATLALQNSKRKRELAEQQKEIETQKNLTLLKEQEITTINAMVEGQEKERKRVAEDLHDNLGSVLATLKLHFENLKINREKKKINQEELFNKTESLIDEAYLKVRRIAHAKNAGVIANQGLLIAIQMMAEKISSADKIKIDVIDFGLDKRLENNLEISVFRIIQELVTNIIKHAAAKNATINIAAYKKNLNIIIEDNGKGFDVSKLNNKHGMGINSIKTRVEHLKGTFNIDSTIGKGSSIIIDIPIS